MYVLIKVESYLVFMPEHRFMSFTKICRPVNYSEQAETNGKQHKRELIHISMCGATKHDTPVQHRGKSRQEVAGTTWHRFENRRILEKQTMLRIKSK